MLGRIASDGKGGVGLVFEAVGDTVDLMADLTVALQHQGRRRGSDRQLEVPRVRPDLPPASIPSPANPDFDYPDVYDYFRNPDGTPKYPQRGVDIGAAGTLGATGQIPTGRFNGKMIVVDALHDGDALPWQADWYRKKVESIKGPQPRREVPARYVENANHTDPTTETSRPTPSTTRARCSTRGAS